MLLPYFIAFSQVSYRAGYLDDPVVTARTEFKFIKYLLQKPSGLFRHTARFPDCPVSHVGVAEYTKWPQSLYLPFPGRQDALPDYTGPFLCLIGHEFTV